MSQDVSQEQVIELPVFSTEKTMSVHINSVLCDTQSPYQHIQIFETKEFGRCLVIDGCMQTSEADHNAYDKEILTNLSARDARILVLGGGDADIAIHALRKIPTVKVIVVDLDKEVTQASLQYLHPNETEAQQIEFIFTDALAYLKESTGKFDGIICDLTDQPVGTEEFSGYLNFFTEIFTQAKERLSPEGWISIQAGPTAMRTHQPSGIVALESLIKKMYGNCIETSTEMPSYAERWSFLHARLP